MIRLNQMADEIKSEEGHHVEFLKFKGVYM